MTESDKKIRVIKAGDAVWQPSIVSPEETDAPGEEATMFESSDGRLAIGLWQRDKQRRRFERTYNEVALITEGVVEITDDEGHVVTAGPGDILITPQGSAGYWSNVEPVKKLWVTYEEPELEAYTGPGPF
jgi:uncharacterized cupin superfamily protein